VSICPGGWAEMRAKWVCGGVITLALASGCAPLPEPATPAAPPKGTVVVLVQDSESGKPLDGAGVGVEAGKYMDFTNKRGVLVFERVPAGRSKVKVTRVGYATRLDSMVVRPWQTDTVRVRLVPRPVGQLEY
jgi:hypothetical protein